MLALKQPWEHNEKVELCLLVLFLWISQPLLFFPPEQFKAAYWCLLCLVFDTAKWPSGLLMQPPVYFLPLALLDEGGISSFPHWKQYKHWLLSVSNVVWILPVSGAALFLSKALGSESFPVNRHCVLSECQNRKGLKIQLFLLVLVWLHTSADAQILPDSCLEILFCFFFLPRLPC